MSHFVVIEGTVVTLGQATFDQNSHSYSYIDFRSAEGRPVRADNVKVTNHVHPALEVGTTGKFYFEKNPIGAKDLWGIKRSDGEAAIHAPGHHLYVTGPLCGILIGGLLSLVLIGLPVLIVCLLLLPLGIKRWLGPSRRQLFYDGNSDENAQLMRLEPLRI